MTVFSETAVAYLRERGIVPDLAARVGVREEAGAIVWPTVDGEGRPSPRRRFLAGDGPKVRGEAGRSLAPWWPLGPLDRDRAVLVAEGESDALAACCALASPEADRDGSVRVLREFVGAVVAVPGTSFPADRLVAVLRDVGAREVILALDADDAGRKATAKYADALAGDGLSCSVLSLPDGQDLAACLAAEERPAWWLANALAEAEAVAEEERPGTPAGCFPLLTAEDLLALPDPSWLIDGLIPDSGLAVLYGAPGSCKSFAALDWALCVAAGLPWLGRDVEQRWVVYVAAEGRRGLGARYRAWRDSRGGPDVSRIRFLPEAVNLLDQETVGKARRTLDSLPEQPGLLVIDTMARSMVGGDENAAKDVSKFIAAVDGLRGENVALVVHHAGHGADRERGSSALPGAADVRMFLKRDGRSPRLELSCPKLKESPEWDPIPLRLESVGESCVLSLAVEVEAARDDLEDVVLAAIGEIGPASKNRIAEKVGRQRQAVLRLVDALDAAGKVRATPEGWEVVPAAREPARNCLSAAQGGGGSPPGGNPVGVPGGNRPAPDPSPADGTGPVETSEGEAA